MTLKAPHISYEQVSVHVDGFLKKYYPSCEPPIPIEGIIEFDLGLHIVPMDNLYKIFRQSGFLSADRTKIVIDEYQYDNFIEKYRFTLAHEVGHLILHKSLYEGISFNSVEGYFKFIDSMHQEDLYWFESQADWFAGQLLAPAGQLEKKCVDLLEANRSEFSHYDNLPYEFWSYASNALADVFEVSPAVVEIRIRKLSLADKFRNYYSGD